MGLYDPNDYDPNAGGGGWKPKPGVYPFEIRECVETRFKTGSHGITLTIDVFAGGKYPVKAFERVVFPAALWKMEQICHSIGIPFDPAPEAGDLIDKGGEAEWDTVEGNNGKTYLEAKEFLAKADGPLPGSDSGDGYDYGPPPMTDDDVPF
jgi:hypothetical protein